MKVIVEHAGYGCETGCCGHVVRLPDADEDYEKFFFDHPYDEEPIEFAKRLVEQALGAKHVADLDWDSCEIIDD
jgi:hypothetical protein